MKRLPYLFMFVIFSVCTVYGHLYLYTFEEKVQSAELILVAKVTEIRRKWNGVKYATVEPQLFIVGEEQVSNLRIKYGQPFYGAQEDTTHLESNKRYIMFLKSEDYHYILVGAGSGYYVMDENDNVLFENKLQPLKDFIDQIRKVRNNRTST